MSTIELSVPVTSEVATAYRAASEDERRKLNLLVSLQLTDFLRSPESLEDVIGEMSREAQQRGLTPEILDSLLHD